VVKAAGSIVGKIRRAHRRRARIVGLVVALITFAVVCISVSVGDFPIPIRDVVPALFGQGDPSSDFIVHTLRLPRVLTGLLVGAAFGFSGSIFQTLARNPLASPDVIGITEGAAAGAVIVIVGIGGELTTTGMGVSLGALGGALITATAIYLLAYRNGLSPYRLVLVGIGVGAVMAAITSYLLTRAEIYDVQRAAIWLAGSLNGRGWEYVKPLTVMMLIFAPAVLYLARPLRALQLGDDTAKGLGASVEPSRAGLVFCGVILAAGATAAAGPIAFVAFIAPPIARRLTRTPGATMIPAALCGALLLTAADLIGRRVMAPTEIPVGIVTGIIGAPYLLWLLARANRVGAGG
jgi:iron complex transport system permease protein